MGSLLPLKSTTSDLNTRDREPQLVDFTTEDADEILPAISSTTARTILKAIYDDPKTTSEIADQLDTSVQNVSYHLERLSDAHLVEVGDTWYSSQGKEMDVYVPANGPLVLYVGAEETTPSLTEAISRVVGAIGVVGVTSVLVHFQWPTPEPDQPSTLGTTEPADPTLWESFLEFGMGPGGIVLWFGLCIIGCWLAIWYWRQYRPNV